MFSERLFGNSPALSSITQRGNLYEYTLATNKNDQWELNSSVKIYPPKHHAQCTCRTTAAIVSNQQNDTYLVGAGLFKRTSSLILLKKTM